MAKAASAERTPVRREAATRAEAAKVLPLLLPSLLAIERDVAVRALVLTGVMKAVEELRDRAAAVRKREDFMVMVWVLFCVLCCFSIVQVY